MDQNIMSDLKLERDSHLLSLARTLSGLREREKIPLSEHRAKVRARLVEAFDEISLTAFQTRIGWIGVAWSSRGIASLQLPRRRRARALHDLQRTFPGGVVRQDAPQIVNQLREYAEGQRRAFELPLDWSAMRPFQRAVLETISQIPFGETRTYAWVAREIGKPRASRAVGRALGANPIPIILPCHRVIGSDGGLHGYGGGLPMKKRLLVLEGAAS